MATFEDFATASFTADQNVNKSNFPLLGEMLDARFAIEELSRGYYAVIAGSITERDAQTPSGYPAYSLIRSGDDAGYYTLADAESSWVKSDINVADLFKEAAIFLTVTGGTATAIEASANQTLPTSLEGVHAFLFTTTDATGATTISVEGLPATSIVSNRGTAIIADYWSADSLLELVYVDGKWQAPYPADVAVSTTAAEDAAAAAAGSAAALSGSFPQIGTLISLNDIDAENSWDFDGDTTQDWFAANATLVAGTDGLEVTSTTTGHNIRITSGVDIAGSNYRYLAVKVKIESGGDWGRTDCVLLYSTGSHTFSFSHYAKPINYDLDKIYTDGDDFVIYFDMHDLTAGGIDWKDSTITGLRFDFDEIDPREYTVKSIWPMSEKNALSSATYLPLLSRLNDQYVFALEEGVNADSVDPTTKGSDDTTAVEATINKAISLKKQPIFPIGRMRLTRRIDIELAGFLLSMSGVGQLGRHGTQFVCDGTTDLDAGMTFHATNAAANVDLDLTDFTMIASGPSGGTIKLNNLLTVKRDPAPGLRNERELHMRRVNAYCDDEQYAPGQYRYVAYSDVGVHVRRVRFPLIEDCWFNELPNMLASAFEGSGNAFRNNWLPYQRRCGLLLDDCYGWELVRSFVRSGVNPIEVLTDSAEGGTLFRVVSNFGKVGILLGGTNSEPGVDLMHFHLNVRDLGIQADRIAKAKIQDCLFYLQDGKVALSLDNPDSTINPQFLSLGTNAGDNIAVRNTRFEFVGHKHADRFIFCRDLSSGSGLSRSFYGNFLEDNDTTSPFKSFYHSNNRQRVYADGSNVTDSATQPWINDENAGYQFEQTLGKMRRIYGHNIPTVGTVAATIPGELLATSEYVNMQTTAAEENRYRFVDPAWQQVGT